MAAPPGIPGTIVLPKTNPLTDVPDRRNVEPTRSAPDPSKSSRKGWPPQEATAVKRPGKPISAAPDGTGYEAVAAAAPPHFMSACFASSFESAAQLSIRDCFG